ncbi:MAG: DUF1549 domain-containing protein, partial [Gemmata sp.]
MPRPAILLALLVPAALAALVGWGGVSPPPARGAEQGAKAHWAFKAPERPRVPAGANPVDHFVRARLEAEKLKPAPEADRVTLVRRLHLDLTGLPPAPDEVDAFVADQRPGAYELLVEKLLASPHYGERWARWWLDAAR